jgi:hypothetical protein
MPHLTPDQLNLLKCAGFRRYEISHYLHDRHDKIAKKTLRKMRSLIIPKIDRNKPIIFTPEGIKLRCLNLNLRIRRNKQ